MRQEAVEVLNKLIPLRIILTRHDDAYLGVVCDETLKLSTNTLTLFHSSSTIPCKDSGGNLCGARFNCVEDSQEVQRYVVQKFPGTYMTYDPLDEECPVQVDLESWLMSIDTFAFDSSNPGLASFCIKQKGETQEVLVGSLSLAAVAKLKTILPLRVVLGVDAVGAWKGLVREGDLVSLSATSATIMFTGTVALACSGTIVHGLDVAAEAAASDLLEDYAGMEGLMHNDYKVFDPLDTDCPVEFDLEQWLLDTDFSVVTSLTLPPVRFKQKTASRRF